MQFSKKIIVIAGIIAIFGIPVTAAASIWLGLSEMISIAIITAIGSIIATSIVWYLKKSQVENNTRIYMEAYKDLAKFKYEHNEDISDFIDDAENNLLDKMNNNLNSAIDEAAELIQKEELD